MFSSETMKQNEPLAADPVVRTASSEELEWIAEQSHRLEGRSPEEILAWTVDRYFPRFTMATGLGPEGCVIISMLAKIEPQKTLLKTVEAVEQTAREGCSTHPLLKEGETLRIPALNFNVKHTFPELSDKRFVNKGKEDWAIDKAVQWTRFRLNQKGALLKSEARFLVAGCAPSPNYVPPRRFVFDKPFLISLKQKDASYPYFAMWVGNTELMVKKG